MAIGVIKRVLLEKSFGFIRDADGQEWFFHRSAVTGATFEGLQEGQAVSFDPQESPKGPRAENVTVQA